MEKHAYLIMAHASFGLLGKLLEALDDERNDIFVHIDARKADVPYAQLHCKRAGLYFTDRIPTHWGGPSQIWAELILLETALAKGHHSYYHLLSGVDLPIKSQDYIHDFFERNAGKELVSFWKMKKNTPSRFVYTPFAEHGLNFFANLANCIFKGVQTAFKFGHCRDVDYRYGANWFSITEALAGYVVERKEWIRKVFDHRCNCDEIFLQTLVWNSPFFEKCWRPGEEFAGMAEDLGNLRLTDWTRGPSVRHPWVFEDGDYEMLTNSSCLFARKFSQGSGIVDRILEYTKQEKVK